MATDFQKIEAHNVDIENFSYNVSDIVNNLYIGPQGELLEMIEEFNTSFNCNIGITKLFTLKPGGYEEIKKAYGRWVLRYDLRPRGIKSLFKRIREYGWRIDSFKRRLLHIEDRMQFLRSSGITWQNNTDDFTENFNRIKSEIGSTLDQVREMYPNIEVTCKMIPADTIPSVYRNTRTALRGSFPSTLFTSNPSDFILMFYVKIKNPSMSIQIMDGNNEYKNYILPMEDIMLASGTYLLPFISRHWNKTDSSSDHNMHAFFLEAIYLSKMCRSSHPYIGRSTDGYTWKLGGNTLSSNICMGNMECDIRKSLINNDIMAHIVNLITWVTTYYVPQTNPLNRVSRIRGFGEHIKFVEWRNDLNTYSADIFNSRISSPSGCTWNDTLDLSILNYARNGTTNFSTDWTDRFTSEDVEWNMRIHEYLNAVELDDMPCNTCTLNSECSQWDALQIIFKDSLDFEEEAFLGMLYELNEFMTLMNDDDRNRRGYYVEMALREGCRQDIENDYFKLSITHKLCRQWSQQWGDTFSILGSRYRGRMTLLWDKSKESLNHLFENHYLNDKSEFVWTVDNVRSYTVPSDFSTPEEILEEALDDVFEDLGIEPVVEALTIEQRTIQWAIANGGAQNL